MISNKIIYLIAILSFQFLTINFSSAQITEEEEIFKVVEQMPRFVGCENSGLKGRDLKKCAEDKMLDFIYTNIEYPKVAKDNGIEGRIILQFVVNRDGSISDTRVVRDIAGGCGNEAARVVNSMPTWIPGKQRGKPVRVQYTLPVTFKLDKVVEEEEAPVFEDQSIEEEPPRFVDTDIEEEAPRFVDTDIEEESEIEVAPKEESEIFKVAEEMPRFPGCEEKDLAKIELRRCSENEMLKYIYSNLKYPAGARAKGIEGSVILRFVVNEDGSISNTKIIKELGEGCSDEAVRIINSMPTWTPAMQKGQPVKIQYTLPVRFRLR